MNKKRNEKRLLCSILFGNKVPFNSNSGHEKHPLAELISLTTGEECKRITDETALLYIREGVISLSSSGRKKHLLTENQMLLVLPGEHLSFKASIESSFIFWKVKDMALFYEYVRTKFFHNVSETNNESEVLDAHKHIAKMFELFTSLIKDGFYYPDYIKGKQNELIILMRSFYTKEELVRFFQPLHTTDYSFKKKVLLHYSTANNVTELASKVNLSRSAFHHHFKKVLGKSPYRWMNEEKAKQIFSELTVTSKPIKEIWVDYGFSSASYFNQFCRKYLGDTPARIRKGRK